MTINQRVSVFLALARYRRSLTKGFVFEVCISRLQNQDGCFRILGQSRSQAESRSLSDSPRSRAVRLKVPFLCLRDVRRHLLNGCDHGGPNDVTCTLPIMMYLNSFPETSSMVAVMIPKLNVHKRGERRVQVIIQINPRRI